MAIKLTVPTKWNELSTIQLKNICYQLEIYQQLVKDAPDTIELNATKLYLTIAKELLRENNYKAVRIALKEIQPKTYVPYSQFIFNSIERTRFIKSFTVNKVQYFGPDIRLRNSTIAEFAFADVAFYKWRQSKNNIWLSVLVATLYREHAQEPTEIDIRRPFLKQAVDARVDKINKLDYKTKLAIAYTYEGCRNNIAKTYPRIFPKPIETEETKKNPLPPKKYVGFGEIILDKIEGDPAKLKETNSILTYDFLSIYDKDIRDLPKKQKQWQR